MSGWEQLSQYVMSGLTTGSIYALAALGFCLIYNATHIVNFAQGDFISLGGLMLYTLLGAAGLPAWVALPLAVVVVAGLGVLLEAAAVGRSKSNDITVLIFVTVAASVFLRGIFKQIWGKQALAVPPLVPDEPLRLLGATFTPQNLWILGITLAAIAGLIYFFNHTLQGRAMRAVAINPKAAALMGIDTRRMVRLSFALAGGLGALAGAIITPITTASYNVGVLMGLKGFAAAVLGGYGNFLGAIIGGLSLGLLESLGAGVLFSAYKDVIAFVVLLLVLFVRPKGLLGAGEETRV